MLWFLKRSFYIFRDSVNNGQQDTRRTFRPTVPLLPVAQRAEREPELHCELRLAHAKPMSDSSDIDLAGDNDLVITTDIPLAARCLGKGAAVLGPKGRPFDEQSIGEALATRELLSQLRDMGEVTGGPAPFQKKDRSLFLQELDKMVNAIRRR